MRWGCPPSDCQYVSLLLSLSSPTPLPGFAVDSDNTASRPISRYKFSWLHSCATTTGAGFGPGCGTDAPAGADILGSEIGCEGREQGTQAALAVQPESTSREQRRGKHGIPRVRDFWATANFDVRV